MSQKEIKNKVLNIIKEVLGEEDISLSSELLECGCNSLKCVRIQWEIQNQFGIEIPLYRMLTKFTIRDIVDVLCKNYECKIEEKNSLHKKEICSFIGTNSQFEIYMANLIDLTGKKYHLVSCKLFFGKFDMQKANKAIKSIIERHSILRCLFKLEDNLLKIKISKKFSNTKIKYIYGYKDTENCIDKCIIPFDLENDFPIRFFCIKSDVKEYVIVMDCHHVAIDGYSINILWDEFWRGYSGKTLKKDVPQYWEYTTELKNVVESKTLEFDMFWNKQKEYLSNSKSDFLKGNKLDKCVNMQGQVKKVFCSNEELQIIEEFISKHKLTHYMYFLMCFSLLAFQLDKNMATYAITSIGRTSKYKNTVGMFAKVLPYTIKIEKNDCLLDLCLKVKSTLLKILENQEIYETYANELIKTGKFSGDYKKIMFTCETGEKKNYDVENARISGYYIENYRVKNKFSLEVWVGSQGIEIIIMYDSRLYTKDNIDEILNLYKKIVNSVAKESVEVAVNEMFK